MNRRRFLRGGAVAGVGAATAALVGATRDSTARDVTGRASGPTAESLHGSATLPFYGRRQAGVDTVVQSHTALVALDLHEVHDTKTITRLMRLLTDDAARLTQGRAALADPEPELALIPARLTVTFGFGERIVELAGRHQRPSWLRPLPAFSIDKLDPAQSGGDLLMHIAADDLVTLAHAQRMLLKDARSFGSIRWVMDGFRRSVGSEEASVTMRNLFGQVDGTATPQLGSADMERIVWGRAENPAWLEDGTSMVLRKIAMDLDGWDQLDRRGREESVGRRLSDGAPLTGNHETDDPDFDRKGPLGFPVIAEFSHMRRAHSSISDEQIFRRGYNYASVPTAGSVSDAGLIFISYQADVERQFVPIQKRLDTLDLLNEWTTPVASSVFAIPPGCREGGFIGDTLFTA